jgi:probable F420-dependent oxidoreductase
VQPHGHEEASVTRAGLGEVGIIGMAFRHIDLAEAADAAAELEELGFGTIWLPSSGLPDREERLRTLLEATRTIVVATGILSIWAPSAAEAAAMHTRLRRDFGDRFLLGLGISHRIEPWAPGYNSPLAALAAYLDELDAAPDPVPRSERVLASLGPRSLELARDRAGGAYPNLTTPDHTQGAREVLGGQALLATGAMVVFEDEPARAKALARSWLELLLKRPNYLNSVLRQGFTQSDVEQISDRLIDGFIDWRGLEGARARIDRHLAAGADHVAVAAINESALAIYERPDELPREEWRRLATILRR